MHYVKHFNINGVATKQVACIELQGKPNTATEGSVGLLGIDMGSPLHDIYKCVAVNGSIYTWELFSSGLSIVSATISGKGEKSVQFPYDNLKTPLTYVVKPGDLIIDSSGYLYQIESLGAIACNATYCGTQVVAYGKSAYDLAVQEGFKGSIGDWLATIKGEPGDTPVVGINNHWWVDGKDTGVDVALKTVVRGSYVGTGTCGEDNPNVLTFERPVEKIEILPGRDSETSSVKYYPASLSSYDYGYVYTKEVPLVLYGVNCKPVINSLGQTITVASLGTTVSWYAPGTYQGVQIDNSDIQRNELGKIYEYIAYLGEENGEGVSYIDTALDNIIAIQEELIGGESK